MLEDGLIFDDDIIAGLGVRDHELHILSRLCYPSSDPKKVVAYPKDAVDACHLPVRLVQPLVKIAGIGSEKLLQVAFTPNKSDSQLSHTETLPQMREGLGGPGIFRRYRCLSR